MSRMRDVPDEDLAKWDFKVDAKRRIDDRSIDVDLGVYEFSENNCRAQRLVVFELHARLAQDPVHIM